MQKTPHRSEECAWTVGDTCHVQFYSPEVETRKIKGRRKDGAMKDIEDSGGD